MPLQINDNIQSNSPKPLNNKEGKFSSGAWRPFNNISEAQLAVILGARYIGLTQLILKEGIPTEYWYRDGTSNEQLIEKSISFLDGVIQDSWYNTNADYNPTTNTGTDDSDILNRIISEVPDGSTIMFRPNRIYKFNQPILTSGKRLSFDLNGSTLYQGLELPIFRDLAQYDFKDVSVNIEKVTVVNPGNDTNSLTRCLKITPDVAVQLKEGDVIKLTSVDKIPGSNTSTSSGSFPKMGQFLIVMQVLDAFFYTTCLPEEVDNYITGLKIHKPKDNKIRIFNGNISGVEKEFVTLTDANPLIEFVGSKEPHVFDIVSLRSAGSVIEFRGCYGHEYDVILQNAETYESVQKYGYGIRNISSQFGRGKLRAVNCRHGYTTNSLPFSDLSSTQSYGRSMFDLVYDSLAYGCNNAGFDTHDGAYGISFDNCHTNGSYAGVSSNGSGFSVRGHFISFKNCTAYNVRYGAYLAEQYNGGAESITFDNCDLYGYERALNVTVSNGGTLLEGVQFINCRLKSDGRYVVAANKTQLSLRGCDLVSTLNEDGLEMDFLNLNQNVTIDVDDVRFIRTGATLTNLVTLQDSGHRVRLRRCRYVSETVNIGRFVKGNGFVGSVDAFEFVTERAINVLLSGSENVTFSYGIRYMTDTRTDLEGVVSQVLSADGLALNTAYMNSQLISVDLTPSGGNRILGDIPNGTFKGQNLTIRNNSASATITLGVGTNFALSTDGVLQNRRSIYFRWNGTAWDEMDGSNIRLSGNQSGIAGRKIFNEMVGFGAGAGSGSSIANTAMSVDMANGGGCAAMFGADNSARIRTTNTPKFNRWGTAPYVATNRPVAFVISENNLTENILNFGGSTSTMDAVTAIDLWTGAINTQTGVKIIRVDQTGARYLADMSASYTDRHLVDRKFVLDSLPKYIPVSNTTDVVTATLLNTRYPIATFPIGTEVDYYNQGISYRRVTATIWRNTPTNLTA